MPMTPDEREALEALEECIRVCREWGMAPSCVPAWTEWTRKARIRAESDYPEPERLWSLIHAMEKLLAAAWNTRGQESRDKLLPFWRVCERLHTPGGFHFYDRITPAPPSMQ